MRINLSKKTTIIVIAIFAVVLAGAGGYLLWRVNNQSSLAPGNSEAANCTAKCDPGSTKRYAGVYGQDNCNEDEAGFQAGEQKTGGAYGSGFLWCCKPYTVTCTSTCGNGTCESGENSSTCASDCKCSAFTWTNKPSGSYTQANLPNPVVILNPNSTNTSSTSGITIKLNSTTLPECQVTTYGEHTSSTGGSCFAVSAGTGSKQQVSIYLHDYSSSTSGYLSVGSYTLSVSLTGNSSTCTTATTETATFTVTSSVAQCSSFTWASKPIGSYTPAKAPKTIIITNPNSTSTSSATGITIKLNNTTLSQCQVTTADLTASSVGVSCFSVSASTNSSYSGKQAVTVYLGNDANTNGYLSVGSYTLSVSLPGDSSTCAKSESATFTVASTTNPTDQCTAFVWSNKPNGSYIPANVPNPVVIINPNSTNTSSTTGVSVLLNGTTLSQCEATVSDLTATSQGVSCFSVGASTNANYSGKQAISVYLRNDSNTNGYLSNGSYTLTLALLGNSSTCTTTSTEAVTFTVSDSGTNVPQTGLFDSALAKISLGAGLIFMGFFVTQFYKVEYIFGAAGKKLRTSADNRRRSKVERRFK